MHANDDELPAFLDRKRWTLLDWERVSAAWDQHLADERRELARVRAAQARATRKAQEDREAAEVARVARREKRLQRAQARERKGIVRAGVLHLITTGQAATFGQIGKKRDFAPAEIRSAIRALLKDRLIEKASARQYRGRP